MKGVHILHKLGINHCDIKLISIKMNRKLSNDDMYVDIRISDFGRSTQNKLCEIHQGYYVDEMLKLIPKEILEIGLSEYDSDQANFLDIYSIAATIVSMESQIHLDLDKYTLLMAIKVMRMFTEKETHENNKKNMHRMIDR